MKCTGREIIMMKIYTMTTNASSNASRRQIGYNGKPPLGENIDSETDNFIINKSPLQREIRTRWKERIRVLIKREMQTEFGKIYEDDLIKLIFCDMGLMKSK